MPLIGRSDHDWGLGATVRIDRVDLRERFVQSGGQATLFVLSPRHMDRVSCVDDQSHTQRYSMVIVSDHHCLQNHEFDHGQHTREDAQIEQWASTNAVHDLECPVIGR